MQVARQPLPLLQNGHRLRVFAQPMDLQHGPRLLGQGRPQCDLVQPEPAIRVPEVAHQSLGPPADPDLRAEVTLEAWKVKGRRLEGGRPRIHVSRIGYDHGGVRLLEPTPDYRRQRDFLDTRPLAVRKALLSSQAQRGAVVVK